MVPVEIKSVSFSEIYGRIAADLQLIFIILLSLFGFIPMFYEFRRELSWAESSITFKKPGFTNFFWLRVKVSNPTERVTFFTENTAASAFVVNKCLTMKSNNLLSSDPSSMRVLYSIKLI